MQSMNVYHSQSEKYEETFKFYLEHSNEKVKTHEWLDQLVKRLPSRHLMIDAGAGYGLSTALFTDYFVQTIAVEPNDSFIAQLKKNCPAVEVQHRTILHANLPPGSADLILCLHVFYHIVQEEWMANLEKLASWLSPNGVLVVAMANHESQCMKIYESFYKLEADLTALAATFKEQKGHEYDVIVETIPLNVRANSFQDAYTLAEFMLNPPPTSIPPTRRRVEEYVHQYFNCPDGGYCFSCDQVLLQIRRRA